MGSDLTKTNASIAWKKAVQKHSIFIVLLAIIIISALLSPNFLRPRNITNVIVQLTVATILAYGEMLLIIGGMLDLSCGAVLALSGVLSVSLYKATGNILLAVLLALVIAVACNLVNAFFIAKFKLPAFIVTLAMSMIARGLALLYTGGQNILQIGDYNVLGQGKVFGVIPVPVLFLIGITVIIWYILNQTRLGRSVYAIGGNEEAAVAGESRVGDILDQDIPDNQGHDHQCPGLLGPPEEEGRFPEDVDPEGEEQEDARHAKLGQRGIIGVRYELVVGLG